MQGYRSTMDADLLHLAAPRDGQHKPVAFHPPVLVIPLAQGLAQDREDPQRERAMPDGARIAKRLVLDGAWQHGGEVLSAHFLPASWQHSAVQGGRAATNTLTVLRYSWQCWQCARKRAAWSAVG